MRIGIIVSLLCSWQSYASTVAAGDFFSCAWDGRPGPPMCWGANDHGELDVPPEVTNVIELGAGAWHACALFVGQDTHNKVRCWGYKDFGATDVPGHITSPLALSVGRWHTCVLHIDAQRGTDVSCFGGTPGQADQLARPDDLNHPTAVFAGPDFTCAHLLNEEVHCWGSIEGKWPGENFPQLTSNEDMACRKISSDRVDCWNQRKSGGRIYIASSGLFLHCKFDDETLSCLDRNNKSVTIEMERPLFRPRDMVVGGWHVCVQDRIGLVCGGENSERQADVPKDKLKFGPMFLRASDAPIFLTTLAEFVYSFDAEFLNTLAQLAKDAATQTMVMRALRPYLADFGYRQLKEDYCIAAIQAIDKLGDGAQPDTRLKLTILAQAIKSAKILLNASDLIAAEKLVALLGDLIASGGEPSQELVLALDGLFGRMASSPYLQNRALAMQVLLTQ